MKTRNSREWDWKAGVLIGIVLLIAVPVFIKPFLFVPDDALFYPQVAYYIVRTGRSTFNDVTLTNGYHPLWMIVNVVALMLSGARRMAGLHILLCFETIIVCFSLLLYRRLVRIAAVNSSFAGTAIFVGMIASSFWGMEAHITVLFLLLSALQFIKCTESKERRNLILLGILLGLTTLSRLDDIFYAITFILLIAVSRDIRAFLRTALTVGMTFACVLAPYLVLEKMVFGHPMPVSGAIKSSFPHITAQLSNLGSLGELTALFAVTGVLLSFLKNRPLQYRGLLRALSLGTLLQASYTVLFTRDHSTQFFWYYASALLTVAFILDAIVSIVLVDLQAVQLARTIRYAVLCCGLLLIGVGLIRSWAKLRGVAFNPLNARPIQRIDSNGTGMLFQQRVAYWMKDQLPEGSVVLASDFPGALAFLTDDKIVPLDGLIGDYKYNDELRQRGINEFITRTNARYYMGPHVGINQVASDGMGTNSLGHKDGQSVEISSPLYRKPAGSIDLLTTNLILDINQRFGDTGGHGLFAVWRLTR
jgi:hypothetical protein